MPKKSKAKCFRRCSWRKVKNRSSEGVSEIEVCDVPPPDDENPSLVLEQQLTLDEPFGVVEVEVSSCTLPDEDGIHILSGLVGDICVEDGEFPQDDSGDEEVRPLASDVSSTHRDHSYFVPSRYECQPNEMQNPCASGSGEWQTVYEVRMPKEVYKKFTDISASCNVIEFSSAECPQGESAASSAPTISLQDADVDLNPDPDPSPVMKSPLEPSAASTPHIQLPPVGSLTATSQGVDMTVLVSRLMEVLPPLWTVMRSGDSLSLMMLAAHPSKPVQRTVIVNSAGSYQLFVHGQEISPEHEVFQNFIPVNLHTMSEKVVLENLRLTMAAVRLFEICTGVPKVKYRSLWQKVNGATVDTNQFKERRYQETCRSDKCQLIVPQLKRMCPSCNDLSRILARRLKSQANIPCSPSGRVRTPKKTKPDKDLSTPEKAAKMHDVKRTLKKFKMKTKRLQDKLSKLIDEEAVEVDEEMDEFLEEIISGPESTARIEEGLTEGKEKKETVDFLKIFVEQQLQARRLKNTSGNKCGMRWHPLLIRFALHLQMTSPSAYHEMRGFLEMPSERTLFDYSHVFKVQEGCHLDIIKDVAERVAGLSHSYQQYHTLLFDEIYINQNLVARKHDGSVVGYCHLDDVTQELLQLQQTVDAAAVGVPVPHLAPPLAKTMLTYMVKGTSSGVKNVVAAYSLSNGTKEDLYRHTWEVVEKCECSGIKIIAMVCDGGSLNRGFIDMNPPRTTDYGVTFDTVNPYDPNRPIFFLSDVPHLVKTVRNCFSRSGYQKSRKLYKNGEFIVWQTIVDLFKHKSSQTVKKLHKLTAACVYLNGFSCQNTKLAFRVLSQSVSNALQVLKWPNTKETSIFK